MSLRTRLARSPLFAGTVFQAALIPLALGLAYVLAVPLAGRIAWNLEAVVLGAMATLPMLALLGLLAISGWPPYREMSGQVREFVHLLFRHAAPGAVLLISILAGIGEELLIRGVLQGWLMQRWPPEWAIVAAAVVFGMAHAISRLYFAFATLIGVYLGVLYYLTDNLLVVIVTHALYDWIVIRLYLRGPANHRPQ